MSRLLPTLALAAALSGVALLAPPRLSAQEVEIHAHAGTSSLAELESTRGLGLAGRFPLLEWLDVQVSLSQRAHDRDSFEEVCTQWQPRWDCYDEGTSYESTLREASVVLLPALVRTDNLRLAVGAGMSLNRLHSNGTGESGRPVAINLPGGAQRGFIGVADVTLSPGRRAAWALVLGGRLHRADLDACVADDERIPVIERFCGAYTFKEVRAGVAFRF